MGKGSSVAAVMMLGALLSLDTPARSDEAGCAALAEWVKSTVAAAARERRPGAGAESLEGGGDRLASPLNGPHTCGDTAAVASRAFGEAIRSVNVTLAWNGDWIRPGDYCLSHDLRQCYPSHHPLAPLPAPSEFAFVYGTWRSLTRALESQMPYGTPGDLSHFTETSLDAARFSGVQAVPGTGAETLRDLADDRSRPRR